MFRWILRKTTARYAEVQCPIVDEEHPTNCFSKKVFLINFHPAGKI